MYVSQCKYYNLIPYEKTKKVENANNPIGIRNCLRMYENKLQFFTE